MRLGIGCIYACAPLTLIASILLFTMAVMLRSGNWTFEVLAAKHGWDRRAKARTCRNGGIIYICISTVLWCLVLLDSFLIHLVQVPSFLSTLWRQQRLPSWRELRRTAQKPSSTRTQSATDVVVITDHTSPPEQPTNSYS
ncbi:hypothetical protein ABL78_2541 [Leptomonas seymouri]|uniref:Uncharacterized protein n=1 Tax=Leptomonas seymouri TaxID=5684 RepID=A0A0N0P742_LEPSE|nr:hypothetical protein ABL78_2541 [Leptomonas seymouri]|eukprot:KPI88366.1 hypothetical protein ABL78_2541 [Leptomonas seymouri]